MSDFLQSDFLQKARDAEQQQNWPLLNYCLEQLLSLEQEPSTVLKHAQAVLFLALQVLQFGDFQTRWDVARLFPAFGQQATAPLINLLQNEEVETEARWFAARILGQLNDPHALRALVALLQDSEDEDLALMATDAVANLGETAIATLAELLTEAETRPLAVQALAQIRRVETIEPLLTVVEDSQPGVRTLAIEALSSFHDPRIPPVLVRALADPSALVRRSAIAGLAVRSELAEELDLVTRLSDLLADVSLEVCQQAAIALGRIGGDAAATRLFRTLESPYLPQPLQLELVRALSWIGSETALDYLEQALWLDSLGSTEGAQAAYQEIVTVLGRWFNPDLKLQATQILVQLLQSDHPALVQPSIRQAIALSLGQLEQPQALMPLIQLLADEEASVRLHAISGLKTLDPAAAYQQLQVLATHESVSGQLRQGVAIALQEWSF